MGAVIIHSFSWASNLMRAPHFPSYRTERCVRDVLVLARAVNDLLIVIFDLLKR
jgi:hypothetical protein